MTLFKYLLAVVLFTSSITAVSQNNFAMSSRNSQSLHGDWKIIVDPYENGYYNYRYEAFDQQTHPERSAFFTDSKAQTPTDLIEYDFDLAESLEVPGDWNTQTDKLYYYEASVWYRTRFDVKIDTKTQRAILYFGAVNYRADVYFNSKKLGVHEGGFTPFYFDVTDLVKTKDNSLVLKVDNKRHADAVPTLNTDWWNYGGITRDVEIAVVPKTYIQDYRVYFHGTDTQTLHGDIWLANAKIGELTEISIPELHIKKKVSVDAKGHASFSVNLPKVDLWTPEYPVRYAVNITAGKDTLTDMVGLRTITTEGKQLLLNNKPIFLRGIAIHEEYAAEGGGRVRNIEEAKQLLLWAKELGCNFVRLAHYPHNEDIVRLADEMGLMVWSEIPVYWTIDWANDKTYQLAEEQLTAMIERDRNRASVIIWSLANETPVSEIRNQFLAKLAAKARTLDSSRLLSAAMEKHSTKEQPNVAIVEDKLAELVDIVSFNQYIGWYDGLPAKAETVSWHIPYNKPVFISEFGGGAKFGNHGDVGTRWTEEYQADLYTKTLTMLEKIDGFAGVSPWILADFRSPRRLLSGTQDHFNRKGVLSEKGEKKQAFFVLQEYYKKKSEGGAELDK